MLFPCTGRVTGRGNASLTLAKNQSFVYTGACDRAVARQEPQGGKSAENQIVGADPAKTVAWQHRWPYCYHCDTSTVIRARCGTKCCNGVIVCDACPSAHQMMDKRGGPNGLSARRKRRIGELLLIISCHYCAGNGLTAAIHAATSCRCA